MPPRLRVLLTIASAVCYDPSHEVDAVCAACHGEIVHPTNGKPTKAFIPCFEAVEQACSTIPEAYSFCYMWNQGARVPADAGMMHVIEVENFKNKRCPWHEPFKHEDNNEESEYEDRIRRQLHSAGEPEVAIDAVNSEPEQDPPPAAAVPDGTAAARNANLQQEAEPEPVPSDEMADTELKHPDLQEAPMDATTVTGESEEYDDADRIGQL